MRMLVSDLDGTLLGSEGEISRENLDVLEMLGEQGIIRVIATGRSRYSFFRAVPMQDIPLDYLIFSTGTGIMDLRDGQIIYRKSLKKKEIEEIGAALMLEGVCFAIQDEVPENHRFYYFEGRRIPDDFLRRRAAYRGHEKPLESIYHINGASQFLAILDGGIERFREIESAFRDYTVIRTTSPMDHKTIWMEIFPKNVSKGKAVEWLAWKYRMTHRQVVCLGNDYNDLEMLEYAGQSFVTANAPADMRMDFATLCHCDEDVLPELVNKLGGG